MATSMMAPRAEIRIPAYKGSPTLMSVIWATYSSCSMSDTLYPLIPASRPKAAASDPESMTPRIVARMAAAVFVDLPPMRYMVTTVVRAATSMEAPMGEAPR